MLLLGKLLEILVMYIELESKCLSTGMHLTLLIKSDNTENNSLLEDASLINYSFSQFQGQHIWIEGNTCANVIVSEGLKLGSR